MDKKYTKSVIHVLTCAFFVTLLSSFQAFAEASISTGKIVVDGRFAEFIVTVKNPAEEEATDVNATCTVFDANHAPLGTGSETLQHVGPGETVYDKALVELIYEGTPSSATCRVD